MFVVKQTCMSTLIDADLLTKQICKLEGVARRTVTKVRSLMRKGDYGRIHNDARRSGRAPAMTGHELCNVFANPRMLMTVAVRALGCSTATVSRGVKCHGSIFYRIRNRPMLTDTTKNKRLVCVTRLLAQKCRSDIFFYSDEKNWDVDPAFNRQNDRFVSFSEPDLDDLMVLTTKYLAKVMMLGIVASTGDTMSPYWFPRGTRATSAEYMDVLADVILWMHRVTGDCSFIFQQDGVSIHTAKID